MADGRRFALHTLGCKVNQYESQALRESWLQQGYEECADLDRADVVIINTCAVTARAVQDVRRLTRHVHRLAPEASILITGCAAQVLPEDLARLPGVTRVVPQDRKTDLLDLEGPALPAPGSGFAISGFHRARAVLKIQDGCSHSCSYCIVPRTRGPARSRPPRESLDEALRLARAGLPEIVVAGINLRQYGRDLDPPEDLWDFLARLHRTLSGLAIPPRLRLSSLEPSDLTDKALDTLSACPLVVPHLHLSLQSASPAVLKRMGRGHTSPVRVLDFLDRLRNVWPVFGLGADLLLGFPGETPDDYHLTREFVTQAPITYAHVFPFSPRPGTPAATLDGRVDAQQLKQRSRDLRTLVEDKKRVFLTRLLDLDCLEVVVEDAGPCPGQTRGTNQFYVECLFASALSADTIRTRVSARPVRIKSGHLQVRPVKDFP